MKCARAGDVPLGFCYVPGLETLGRWQTVETRDGDLADSRADRMIPLPTARNLLPQWLVGRRPVEIGDDHRLADPEPLAAMSLPPKSPHVAVRSSTSRTLQALAVAEAAGNPALALCFQAALVLPRLSLAYSPQRPLSRDIVSCFAPRPNSLSPAPVTGRDDGCGGRDTFAADDGNGDLFLFCSALLGGAGLRVWAPGCSRSKSLRPTIAFGLRWM